MQDFSHYLNEYGRFHTKRFTFFTHLLGVPLIFLAIQIVFSWIKLTIFIHITLAWLIWLLLSFFYLYLAGRKSLFTIFFLFLLTLCAQYIATPSFNIYSALLCLFLLIMGVLCQRWGHVHEGKKPAFMKNIIHIFIAPLFLMTEVQAFFKRHS